jgi:hypothetical protein
MEAGAAAGAALQLIAAWTVAPEPAALVYWGGMSEVQGLEQRPPCLQSESLGSQGGRLPRLFAD